MSKTKIFLTLSGYQLTWLMCVFGEVLYQSFLPGLIVGVIFLFLFLRCRQWNVLVARVGILLPR